MSTLTANFLLIEMPGGGEMIIILVVVLLLFGGKKIPELMRGLGKGIREFNDAKSSVTKELEEGIKTPEPGTSRPSQTVTDNTYTSPATPPTNTGTNGSASTMSNN